MLFSEPKIPQRSTPVPSTTSVLSFSALQRAENSSTSPGGGKRRIILHVSVLFSEPKIPQHCNVKNAASHICKSFSALQRAENSSTTEGIDGWSAEPTCFSALQRAENSSTMRRVGSSVVSASFSALQRAENSSTISPFPADTPQACVSVLFSEPKIPQRVPMRLRDCRCPTVSVLFSEPKIPQLCACVPNRMMAIWFQCSSASRKFLNTDPRTCVHPYFRPR